MKFKTIKILSQEVEVKESNPQEWSDNGMGRSSTKDNRILINKDMPDDAKTNTLLHEVIHMIANMNSIELNETAVSVLANGLFSFMRENKKVVNEIINGG